MLLRLLRTRLAPYKKWLTVVVVFQFLGVLAALYLPTLNADIIDNGVVKNDTDYILRVGALMLLISFGQIICSVIAVRFGARTAASFGRDAARRALPPGRHVLDPRGPALRRPVADHPHHQRRPAGADAGADVLHDRGVGADHDGRRRDPGAARGPRPGLDPRGGGPGPLHLRGLRGQPDGAELPADAGPHRRGQPGAARADHRHPGGARLRPRAARDRALRQGERRPHRGRRRGRSLDGDDVPAGDPGRERLERRGDLVRRPPGRQRRRCRSVR